MERTPVPDSSPPVPPPTAPTPTDTIGPSYTAQQSPEHIHVNSSCCYGCCMHTCYYSGVVRRADGPSRGQSHAESHHASSDHEPPRSPASQRDRVCIAHYSRSVCYIRSRNLLGYACSRCCSFRSIGVYTTTRVWWLHSLL